PDAAMHPAAGRGRRHRTVGGIPRFGGGRLGDRATPRRRRGHDPQLMGPVPATRAGAILAVSDFAASLSFYRDRLGLEVVATYDDPPYAPPAARGRLPRLLRRPRRLARRDGAAGMKAVVLAGTGDARVEEVEDARIVADTDALVEVHRTAICGADLFPFHGMTPGFENGTILGHEFAGVVSEVGDAVGHVRPGQR